MGIISLVIPQIGQPDTTEDVKVQNAFTAIQTVINGNLDTNNISPTAGITAAQLNTSGVMVPPSGAGITNPARVVGTAYQPSTTRPTFVTVSVLSGGGSPNTIVLKIGATSSPSQNVGGVTLAAATQAPIAIVIPPAWWYEAVVNSGSATIPLVTEVTL